MKQCERLPRRWNALGEWSAGWHALFCVECRQARQADRELARGIHHLRGAAVPAEVETHILQRLGLPLEPSSSAVRPAGVTFLPAMARGSAAAAGAILVIGLAFSYWPGPRSSQRTVTGPVEPALSLGRAPAAEPDQPSLLRRPAPPVPPAGGVSDTDGGGRHAGLIREMEELVAAGRNRRSRQQPSHGPRRRIAMPGDDLNYLNGDSRPDSGRWALFSPDAWVRAEEQVRGKVHPKDSFITIAFPRLAAADARQIALAAESYRREAAIVDSRLAREVTVAAKAMALSDLCEQLRADTGIQLVAGRSVADEKVSLFCRKLPLRDVMRQLSRPFGYTWLRSGKSGEYRYELVQDLKSQLLEEELRNRDRNEALLALDRDMAQFRPYLGVTPEQAQARLKSAPAAEKPLLEKLAGGGWGAIQMYFRLSPRDLAALRAGQTLNFSSQPGQGEQPLPEEVASAIQQIQPPRPQGRPEAPGGPGEREQGQIEVRRTTRSVPMLDPGTPRSEVQLSIEPSELGTFSLVGGSGRMTPAPDGMMMWMSRDSLAVGRSPSVMRPQNAAANAKLAHDPALQKRVDVTPAVKRQGPGVNARDRRSPSSARSRPDEMTAGAHASPLTPDASAATSADALEALHRATGMPIVADFYTRLYRPEAVSVKDLTLFQALNGLADTMRLRWNKADGWLQFRSMSYFHDRLKEVPNRLLNRWAASRRERGYLSLDELIEIAQLSDAQLDATDMAEGARALWGLAEWDLARGRDTRPHLRLLALFTPAQRQAVSGPDGVPFTKLTIAQQHQFIALTMGGRTDNGRSLADLAEAALRVDYSPAGSHEWWAPGKPAGEIALPVGGRIREMPLMERPTVRERSREAALAAARQIDPNATESQIVPSLGALAVVYTTAGPNGRAPLLALRATGNSVNVTAHGVQRREEQEAAPLP